MYKTASMIADEVLEKVAIDLATVRRVSHDVIRKRGIRAGLLVNPVTGGLELSKKSKPSAFSLGPMLNPKIRVGDETVNMLSVPATTRPSEARLERDTIFTGGDAGGLSDVLRGPLATFQDKIPPPQSPLGKEWVNRLGLMHENMENNVIRRGTTYATRSRNWGVPEPATADAPAGLIFGGHLSPRVILQENNMVSTLPSGTGTEQRAADEVRRAFGGIRDLEGSWGRIRSAMGLSVRSDTPDAWEYGRQRLSRHAIRRIMESMASNNG